MNPRARTGLLVLAASAALLVAGCSPTTTVATTTQQPRTVSLSATGTADVEPDAARASLSIVAQDPASATAAQEAAAAGSARVLEALAAARVAEEDIATSGISVGPTYNYTSEGGQEPTGYQATQSLTVTLRDLSTAGATIDAAVAAGGNLVRVDSLVTFVTDPTAATAAARAQAVDVATKQAEQYAELLGFRLGDVQSVSESSGPVAPPEPVAMADSAAESAPAPKTEIAPGTTEVSVTVSISWSIAG
ncbi:MAG: SIMPL domain-containing protein [Candidatus Nanopelagicales bacterium]